MRRGIIPNHRQWSRVLLPQLPQESPVSASEVKQFPELLLPSSSIHSTSAGLPAVADGFQAHRRGVCWSAE